MRCSVVFRDGARCSRTVQDHPSKGWCDPCGTWSRRHGGADPNGRKPPRRTSAQLAEELQAATLVTHDDCVILTGYANRPNVRLNGKSMEASRAVWWIANGDPGADSVLHTCHHGEEGCVSIRHLYLGDSDQNVQDRVTAGRSCNGERHHANKLSTHAVIEIRRRYRAGRRWNPGNAVALAAEFGVSPEQVGRVARGEQRVAESLMVGDRPEDEECARLAGVDFMWAADWRAMAATPQEGGHHG